MKAKDIILIIFILLILVGIGYVSYGYFNKATMEVKNPIATIEIEGYGEIKVELYPDVAPNTVKNFIALANGGFYDGLTFHRTVPDFIIQGGKGENGNPMLSDIMETSESEDKEYTIPGEFITNGYTKNTLRHDRGVISMARLSQYAGISSNLAVEDYNSGRIRILYYDKR